MLGDELNRYTTDAMSNVWSPDWKIRRWAEIETAIAEAQDAPSSALREMAAAPVPRASDVATEEQETRHDVVAFLNLWRGGMGEAGQSWTHRGITSSDLVDTANGMRLVASTDLIRQSLTSLSQVLGESAIAHQASIRVGRTHGQVAEVTTWGWTLAKFFFAIRRAEQRFALLSPLYEVGKVSGPVGDYKRVTTEQELNVLTRLNLRGQNATSQIVMRDAYVDYLHCLSQTASVVEALAMEVRLSSRTEVGEVAEGFSPNQRGSSAMPHKRNPITAEKLTGLARLVRAQVEPVAQGVASHHDRDISHSSVERIALATASQLVDHMVTTATRMMADLRVNTDVMENRVRNSVDLLSALVKDQLVEWGAAPALAYNVVFIAFQEWSSPGHGGYDTISQALEVTWNHAIELLNTKPGWVPEFVDLVKRLNDPLALVGQTADVYHEIETMLEH